ncbi:MAG: hypothetical protein HQM06_09050 [Magnetococcales bacterium]|nr:hypothetical protein [Magnetococcales bacterium]
MARTLDDVIQGLPLDQQQEINQRAADLIAEEMRLRHSRQQPQQGTPRTLEGVANWREFDKLVQKTKAHSTMVDQTLLQTIIDQACQEVRTNTVSVSKNNAPHSHKFSQPSHQAGTSHRKARRKPSRPGDGQGARG